MAKSEFNPYICIRNLITNNMKKIILPLILLSTVSFSQVINQKEIKSDYVQIVGTSNPNCEMNGKTKLAYGQLVSVDLGQKQNVWTIKDNKLLDDDGCSVNSVVDALDIVINNGYKLIISSSILVGEKNICSYLLKKK